MPAVTDFDPVTFSVDAVISASGSTSATADLKGGTLCGILLPATFTGTSLTFLTALAAADTFVNILDDSGTNLTKTVAQGKYLPLDPAQFAGVRFLQVTSSSTEGSARTLKLVCRSM
jgi:hypothetical protein